MTSDFLYNAMQRAVDIIERSPHPTNKVASVICGLDHNGQSFEKGSTNIWPNIIEDKLGTEIQIGTASGTVHAETACILQCPRTQEAAIFITDPPCPNCTKNIVEAGISEIYIDHKGFEKDYARRRGEAFTTMTLEICAQAGISVYQLWRKEKRIEPILMTPRELIHYTSPLLCHEPLPNTDSAYYERLRDLQNASPHPFAAGILEINGEQRLLACERLDMMPHTPEPHEKYTFIQEPLNRLLMTSRRLSGTLKQGSIISSQVPSARELVNLIGAGHKEIAVFATDQARDKSCFDALNLLKEKGVITITPLPN